MSDLDLRPIDLTGSGFTWFLSRPITKAERYAFRVPVVDSRPMSLLGISDDERACVIDEATARLFAAAPSLLEALEASIYALEQTKALVFSQRGDACPEYYSARLRLESAIAAIKKARGMQ